MRTSFSLLGTRRLRVPLLAPATTPSVALKAFPSGKSKKLVQEAACREFALPAGALSDDWQRFSASCSLLPPPYSPSRLLVLRVQCRIPMARSLPTPRFLL